MSDYDSQHESEDDGEYFGTLFPVFCTAKIPLETLNSFFDRVNAHNEEEGTVGTQDLFLVRDSEAPAPREPEATPITESTSSFVGKTPEEISAVFERMVDRDGEDGKAARYCFVVLDERTLRDKNTCLVASTLDDFETARCEFDIALDVLISPEMANSGLNEGREDYRVDGEYLYGTERWKSENVVPNEAFRDENGNPDLYDENDQQYDD